MAVQVHERDRYARPSAAQGDEAGPSLPCRRQVLEDLSSVARWIQQTSPRDVVRGTPSRRPRIRWTALQDRWREERADGEDEQNQDPLTTGAPLEPCGRRFAGSYQMISELASSAGAALARKGSGSSARTTSPPSVVNSTLA